MVTLSKGGKTTSEGVALKANELLLWCSARREGSWRQFRAAVDELHSDGPETYAEDNDEFPLHQKLRLDFERLGHVEFFTNGCEDGWRVAPPTLAAQPKPEGVRSVLCGARSPALQERLIGVMEKLNSEVIRSTGVPDVLRFSCLDSSQLAEAASLAGVTFQPSAPLAILSNLSPCSPPSREQARSEFPVGADWSIHQFNTATLSWLKTDRRRAETLRFGVLRFLIHFQRPRYFLRWRAETFQMPRALALYALLRQRRRKLLSYDAKAQTLGIPATCRPPLLLERALVLCSGLPPVYDGTTSRLSYADVPLDIARFAAELLRQSFI